MNDSAIHEKKSELTPLLYRWDDIVLSFSPTKEPLNPHYHGAAELVIAFDGTVYCNLDQGEPVAASSILIPPGVTHKNQYTDPLSATMYFDSDSHYFRYLTDCMSAQSGIFVSLRSEERCQKLFRWIYEKQPSPKNCREKLDPLVSSRPGRQPEQLDARIRAVLDELRHNPAINERVSYFAAKVALSEDRLHHLFRDEVGLPIHRYRVWLRLKHASSLYLSGHDLTYAAHAAGFSDAAHFSRTFKKMYGASPKSALSSRKNSRCFFG